MIEAVVVVGLSSFVAGFGLYAASKKFSVEKDPRIEEVNEILPGANCGGCGYPGCSALAEAIVKGDAPASACPVGGAELAEKIGKLLGLEVDASVRKVAKIKCHGDKEKCPPKYEYYGPADCHAIVLLGGGNKGCIYGCVGGGSCVKACNFDALKMGDNGIPVVDEKKCTACGLCVKACPRNLIELIDVEKRFIVSCSSKDKGVETKKVCSVGCIGCRLCAKNCPADAITVENNLAYIHAEKCINCGKCEEVCPTKAIIKL